MVWFPFRFSLPLSTSTWNLSCLRLCVWTDRRVVGSRSRPVTRSLLSIFHGPVTLRVQTQAACSLWYTLKPEGVSIAHIKLLHSVIYRVSLWAPSVSLHYRGMRADSPASPPSHTHTHVQTCWIWCHECEFWSNEIIPVALLFVTDWPGAEIQRVFKAQLITCKVMAFNVISGLTEWAIKETWSLWSFPLPAVFTLFTPNTRRNLVLPLGNNMIPPSRFVTLCSALSLRFLRPLTVSYLHWMWQPSFMYLFRHSCSPTARLTHHMSCECCIIFTPYSSSGSILLPPTRLFFCCFVFSPPPPLMR